ncbi:proteoglycan 4-like [Melanotaenia boesemani]|uniref:proteoglycan 4-like n=1 Tax=Melanotaenia boesemani TaxID=1250792 RepID=UPI001C04C50F|nr:proteoglycan 4-like [Melanotaenia boesemani]
MHRINCFREYVELFPSGRIAIAMKEQQYVGKVSQQTATMQQGSAQRSPSQPSPLKHCSTASLSSLLVKKMPSEQNLTKMVKRLVSPCNVKPSLTQSHTQPSSTVSHPPASTLPAPGPSPAFVKEAPSTSAVPGPSSAFVKEAPSTSAVPGPSSAPAHVAPGVESTKRDSRYTVVVRAYKNIRECVITNARLMSETTIQLPEVNAATVSQRYCRQCKAQERDILKQGIPAQQAPMAAPAKLPAALQKGQTVAFGTLAQPHLFVLPPNTAGQAQLKGRPQHQAPPQQFVPGPPAPLPIMVPRLPAMPKPSNIANTPIYISIPPSSPTQSTPQAVPYTTQQYRCRKMEAEQAGIAKRKYSKKTDIIVCSKCQKDRKPPTHRQYFDNWYCEETETQSYEEWRALLQKREYGKRRKKNKAENEEHLVLQFQYTVRCKSAFCLVNLQCSLI